MNPAPGLAIEQQPVGVVHRMQLVGEARGEQDGEGRLESVAMLAVAFVPLNRTARGRWRRRGLDLKAVLLERWQFSCFNENDPNRAKLLEAFRTDPTSWERADTVCDLIESGLTLDPSAGADHYCTLALWNREPSKPEAPQWYERPLIEAGRTRETARWGHHVFAVHT